MPALQKIRRIHDLVFRAQTALSISILAEFSLPKRIPRPPYIEEDTHGRRGVILSVF